MESHKPPFLRKLEEMGQDELDHIVVPSLSGVLVENAADAAPSTDGNEPDEKISASEPSVVDEKIDEKITELKNLISSTNGILTKYHLA